jgi:ATP/maltotriose-dependent transcriptional regulator MalT
MSMGMDFEDLERAYKRVAAEIDAVAPESLTPMNLDVVTATMIVQGVAHRVLSYRERIAKLPEFDMRVVDRLADYAKAAGYLSVTNLKTPSPKEAEAIVAEASALKAQLLAWAVPLVAAGHFAEQAVAAIREGTGYKDHAADMVALVALYRGRWESVRSIIGVTEKDLTRAAELGAALWSIAAKREVPERSAAEGSTRLRAAWSLVDLAYAECRRAVEYLRPRNVPLEDILPSLRRNAGRNASQPEAQPTEPAPETSAGAATPAPAAAAGFGGAGSPFVKGEG